MLHWAISYRTDTSYRTYKTYKEPFMPTERTTRYLVAWIVLLSGMVGFWLVRPWFEPIDWVRLAMLGLFLTSKFATLWCLSTTEWAAMSWRRLIAYLLWPGMQPRQFLSTYSPNPTAPVPTW